MNMLLIEPEELDNRDVARITGSRAQHLRKTLGVTPGRMLRIGLLNGPLGRGIVQNVCEDAVNLFCEWDANVPPAAPSTDLILAMPRPKVMKRLWAQLAMLGVRRIAIVNAENVDRCYFDSHVLLPSFYHNLLVEGLQQAQATHLPQVRIEKRFKVFLEDSLDAWSGSGARLAADPQAEAGLPDVLPQALPRVTLAVGPEPGWTDHERRLLAQHGFRFFTLGCRTLRTDTACAALLTLIRARLNPARPLD